MNALDERHILYTEVKPDNSTFETREEGADFVIQTSDRASLYVHRLILQRTSPVFATLFSLPQPLASGSTNPSQAAMRGSEKDGLPIVALTETKAIWDILLRMLYHHSIPDFSSPYDIRPLLEAARKYELECITDRLSHILSCSTHTASWEPQEIYAIASLYGLTDVALHAARKTLDIPLHMLYTKELYDVPAYIFQRLLDYRWRCAEAASRVAGFVRETTPGARPLGKLLKRIEWLPRTNFTFFRCECGSGTVSCSVKLGSDYEVFFARGYWKEYMERAEQAVRECPVGKVVKDPEIIIPALRAADNCMNCRQHIYLDMMIFTEYLEAAVDGAVSSVSLKV